VTEYQTIKFEQSGPITRITLNRPDAANGMNDTMTRELADAAKGCDTAATKVVVLTGSGRFFCAGGDLKSFATAPSRGRFIKGVADDLHRAISTFARMDAVLIIAVNGVAARFLQELCVFGDLAADQRSQTGHDVAAQSATADHDAKYLSLDFLDAVTRHVFDSHDEHETLPMRG